MNEMTRFEHENVIFDMEKWWKSQR